MTNLPFSNQNHPQAQNRNYHEGQNSRKSAEVAIVIVCALLLLAAASLLPGRPAVAQGSDVSTLHITLLDEDDDPIVNTEISLILLRYTDTGIEQIPSGACRTDENGQCTFEIIDAPRLKSGYAEAFLVVSGMAEQLIGWPGNELDVVLKKSDLLLADTLNVPLETGYDYPPDANEVTATVAEAATETPTTTPSVTPTVQPTDTPSPTSTASATLLPPTATPMPEPQSGKVGILPLACGGLVFTIFAILVGRQLWFNRQKTPGGK